MLRFETPQRKLPYNGVIRTAIDERVDEVVARVIDRHTASGSDFFWLDHPSARPHSLGELLTANGLEPVETATGMSLDLDTWQPPLPDDPAGVMPREAIDDQDLDTYEDLVLSYARADAGSTATCSTSGFTAALARLRRRCPGRRGLPLARRPDGRRRDLRDERPPRRPRPRNRRRAHPHPVEQARTLVCRKVVLHTSGMAMNVYRRAGFAPRCTLTFYATAPLWSTTH